MEGARCLSSLPSCSEEATGQLEDGCLHALDLPGEGTGLTFTWRTEDTASCLPGGGLITDVLLPKQQSTRW